MERGWSHDESTGATNVNGQPVVVGTVLDTAIGRPSKIIVPACSARTQTWRQRQRAVLPLQLGQSVDTGLAVRAEHEKPALGSGRNADVGSGPLFPPGSYRVCLGG